MFDVLLRFRRYPVSVVCDIKEMYLQIKLLPADRSYFRFLWRDFDQQQQPEVYEFERVVFGDASAPFRAQFVTHQNAETYKQKFPLAAETVLKSTYMHDSLDSVKNEAVVVELYHQLTELWKKAAMEPRKWLSNSPKVLSVVPPESRAAEVDLDRNSLPAAKTLGVLWSALEDDFSFRGVDQTMVKPLCKRSILSKVQWRRKCC